MNKFRQLSPIHCLSLLSAMQPIRWALAPWRRTMATKAIQQQQQQPSLSNRKKFAMIQPPPSLFQELERLGFGSLRKTKRYASVHRENKKGERTTKPEPEYTVAITFFPSWKVANTPRNKVPFALVHCRCQGTDFFSTRKAPRDCSCG